MTSPLVPIGYDMPNVQAAQVAVPTLDAPVDTTALQLISQQSSGLTSALQQQSVASQSSMQSSNALATASAASATAIAQSTSQAAQARASRSQDFARTMAQFSVNVSNAGDRYLERVDKQNQRKAAVDKLALEQQQEQAKLAAARRLEQQKLEWTRDSKFDKQGSQAYVGELIKNLDDPLLSPDDITQLTQRYIAPAHEFETTAEGNRQKSAAKVKETQQQISSLELRGKLSAAFGVIGSSAMRSPDELATAKETVNNITREFLSSGVIPQEDKYVILRDSYDQLLQRMDKSNAEYSNTEITARNLRSVVALESQLYDQVRKNEITPAEALARIKLEAAKLDVPYAPTDININSKFVQESLSVGESIQTLQDKREQNAIENMEPNNAVIVGLSTEAYLNPASRAALMQASKGGVNANAAAALKNVEDFERFVKDELPQYSTKRASLNLELQQLNANFNKWWVGETKPNAQSQSGLSFQKQLEVLRGAGITPEMVSERRATPEQLALVAQSQSDIAAAIVQQASTLDQNHQNRLAEFARVGLSPDVAFTKQAHAKSKRAIDGYNQRLQDIKSSKVVLPQVEASKPNFSQGKLMPLPRKQYAGRQMILPFPVDVATAIPDAFDGQRYGASRGGRSHDGLDFAVPTGTPILSVMGGTVRRVEHWDGKSKDYGNNLEVVGDDGLVYHFAHLNSFGVVEGQRVRPGEQLGLSGSTGAGSGPHLHMGVYNWSQAGGYQPINPEIHLSALHTKDAPPPKQPRTSGNTIKPAPASVPQGAIPLGNNKYLSGGKVLDLTTAKQTPATYNKAQPVRNSYSSRNAKDYQQSSPEDSHGYAKLAENPQLARRINQVASKYGMPGQWLADVIAYESANSFSPSIPNGMGFYGLIQFGEAVMQDMGVDVRKVTGMTAVQQMDLVDSYLALRLRQSGVKTFKGPEWLVAAINQGNVGLQQVDKYGASAILDPSNSDGYTTLENYMKNLGKFSGRQYDYLGNRSKRASLPIHSGNPRPNCSSCIAMTHFNGNITAHVAQPEDAWKTS
jgi:murein DD-endopeptidase MepM/ murein hydrolase activator NlpD